MRAWRVGFPPQHLTALPRGTIAHAARGDPGQISEPPPPLPMSPETHISEPSPRDVSGRVGGVSGRSGGSGNKACFVYCYCIDRDLKKRKRL
eukprot:scaffold31447_cov135-Isochrysis_galbana.AAC.3